MSDNYVRLMGWVHSIEYVEGQDGRADRLTFALVEDYASYSDKGTKKDSRGYTYDPASRWHNFVAFGTVAKALKRRMLMAERAMVECVLEYSMREIGGKRYKQPELRIRRFDAVTVLSRKRLDIPCPHCGKIVTVAQQREQTRKVTGTERPEEEEEPAHGPEGENPPPDPA